MAGQPIEDSRVETKSDWPQDDYRKTARQLAGHANAARGEPILWVIGIDEKGHTAPGASTDVEPSNWFAAIAKQFDEDVVPSLRNFALRFNDVTLVALCFETDRAPYVVLNADFGTVRGDPAKREVPWREGNSTRSAK